MQDSRAWKGARISLDGPCSLRPWDLIPGEQGSPVGFQEEQLGGEGLKVCLLCTQQTCYRGSAGEAPGCQGRKARQAKNLERGPHWDLFSTGTRKSAQGGHSAHEKEQMNGGSGLELTEKNCWQACGHSHGRRPADGSQAAAVTASPSQEDRHPELGADPSAEWVPA